MSPIAGDFAPSPLSPGLYEQDVDRLLERRLAALRRSCIEVTDEELDAGDSHAVLADHLGRVVREALGGVIGEDRLARQVELVNRILRDLEGADPVDNSVSVHHYCFPCIMDNSWTIRCQFIIIASLASSR